MVETALQQHIMDLETFERGWIMIHCLLGLNYATEVAVMTCKVPNPVILEADASWSTNL